MSDFKKTHTLAARLDAISRLDLGQKVCFTGDIIPINETLQQAAKALETHVEREDRLQPLFAYCAELSRSVSGAAAERFFGADFHDGQVGDMLREMSVAYGRESNKNPDDVHEGFSELNSQIAVWFDQRRENV